MVNRDVREKKEEISVDGQKKAQIQPERHGCRQKTETLFLNVFNCSNMTFGVCYIVGTESSARKSVKVRVRYSESG